MEGKLAGFAVLRADAKDAQSGPYGVAQALAKQLIAEIPEVALEEVEPYRPILRLIMPELFSEEANASGAASSKADQKDEAYASTGRSQAHRSQVQTALLQWVRAISRRRALLLAVDDIHRIDEPSSAFLALLSHEISNHMLVLAVTAELDAADLSESALGLIREAGKIIKLVNLSVEETERLLSSVFGDVPNVRLLADRLYAISQGNPRMVMQLAQHLVDQGVVRYQSGAWSLPSALITASLPNSSHETLKARLAKLSADAIALGQTMALTREERFSFDECMILADHRGPERLTQNLDALVATDILTTDGTSYAFHQKRWAAVLLDGLSEPELRERYARAAALFEGRESFRFRLSQNLLLAGQEDRAFEVFIQYIENVRERYYQNAESINELINYPPQEWESTLSALIQICKKKGGLQYHIYLLQFTFIILSTTSPGQENDHLRAVVHRLYCDSGLDIYEQLGDIFDPQERLTRALESAQRRYESSPDSEKVLSPERAIRDITRIFLCAIGIAGTALDYALIESLPSVEPLIALSPAFGILEKDVRSTAHILGARLEKARRGYLEILERIDQPDHAGLADVLFSNARFSIRWGIAVIEASWGLESALQWADEMEVHPVFRVNAWRIRLLYYLRQGDVQQAGKCKKQLELLEIQNAARWFDGSQLLSQLYAYSFSDDLIGVKRTIEDIEKLAKRLSAWIPVLHFGWGEYHRIRGDHTSAVKELEHVLGLISAGRHLLWPYVAAAYILALCEAGRFQEGQANGRKLLLEAEAADPGLSCNYIRVALARCEAKASEYGRAIALSEMTIESWKAVGTTGLNIGLAYESRARVALSMNDPDAFRFFAASCAEHYRAGGNPALAAKYARLLREAKEAGIEDLPKADSLFENYYKPNIPEEMEEKLSQIASAHSPSERAHRVIEILGHYFGATGGYLFGLHRDGVKYLSSHNEDDASKQLLKLIDTYLEAELAESTAATVTVADEDAAYGKKHHFALADGRSFQPVLLYDAEVDRNIVVGVAALLPREQILKEVNLQDIYTVSQVLLRSGDVVPRYAAI